MSALPFLIGNAWRITNDTAAVRNPATGKNVAQVCLAGPNDIADAISSAVAAAEVCAALSAFRRAEILRGVGDGIRNRRDEIVDGIVTQVGKPVRYARAEIDRAIITFTLAAEEATRIGGDVIPLDIAPGTEHHIGITRRFPIGVVAAITPFNFPLNLAAHKIAPAFAAGNSVILKPAPQAPLTGLLLGELFLAAGAPAGVLNVVPCSNEHAELLVRDDRIAMLSFTGSASVGWRLRSIAGRKKVILELGGNAPVIVEDVDDISHTASVLAQSAFAYAGQVCISTQRIFVNEKIFGAFCDAMVAAAKSCVVGEVTDEATIVGPLINDQAAVRITQWLEEAVTRGAKVLCGGPPRGTVMSPTILTDVPHDALICAEEAFAPVVILEKYRTFDAAIDLANNSRYGLQAGVFTQSLDKMMQAFATLRIGAVIANNSPSLRVDAMPYGGVKDSGAGREGIRASIEEMTDLRLLVIRG